MTILAVAYASAPTDEVIIPSLQIVVPGEPIIRICNGYENQLLGVDGVLQEFEAGTLSISLPSKDTSGQQMLAFGISNVNGEVQRLLDKAIASNEQIPLVYAEYLLSDPSAPAKRPYRLTVTGGTLKGGDAQIQASYYDLLNSAWPRERYTSKTAPGVRYM